MLNVQKRRLAAAVAIIALAATSNCNGNTAAKGRDAGGPLWFLSADGTYNYTAHPQALTHAAAEAACVQGGGHLMHMDSQAEWDWAMPRALAIWRASFPGIQASWGDASCFFLHAGYRTPGSDAAWETVEGRPLPTAGFLAPWQPPWALCAGCPKPREPSGSGARCAVFAFDTDS